MGTTTLTSRAEVINFKLVPYGKRLWTREKAAKVRRVLEEKLHKAAADTIFRIDCSGVEVFDFSFATELFVKTLSSVSADRTGRCMVIGGLSDYTRENLNAALIHAGLMSVEADGKTVRLLGKFSPSDEETLRTLLNRKHPYTVRELADTLSIQVWRLAILLPGTA